ncbi:hypothetical protein AMECASPLE_019161, partial [Ameca splendens]
MENEHCSDMQHRGRLLLLPLQQCVTSREGSEKTETSTEHNERSGQMDHTDPSRICPATGIHS